MTITSALLRLFRVKFALAQIVFVLAIASLAPGAAPPMSPSGVTQTHAQLPESALILNSAPEKNLVLVFPVMGLIAAIWATHHVRRRNARRLAATR